MTLIPLASLFVLSLLFGLSAPRAQQGEPARAHAKRTDGPTDPKLRKEHETLVADIKALGRANEEKVGAMETRVDTLILST